MNKSIILFTFFALFNTQVSLADRCHIVEGDPDQQDIIRDSFRVSASINANSLFIRSNEGYEGQLSFEEFNRLSDERTKAAIIRSLNTNSSWQQR